MYTQFAHKRFLTFYFNCLPYRGGHGSMVKCRVADDGVTLLSRLIMSLSNGAIPFYS